MPPDKLVLGFDTSAAHCAAALVCGDRVLAEQSEEMSRGQAERLFPLLEDVLAKAEITWSDIDAIGCGIGPGNFTGIRLTVSAARGLALSLGIPAIGVSTFEALAEGLKRPTLTSIDARRDEVYLQFLGIDAPISPTLVPVESIPEDFHVPGVTCAGYLNTRIAQDIGGTAGQSPLSVPTAIAQIAARRIDTETHRPSPLYIRTPDAAPSKEIAPVRLA